MSQYPEIELALKESRHELVLHGAQWEKNVAKEGGRVPPRVFDISTLNLLEMSRIGVETLDGGIGKLQHLLRLVLHSNKLEKIPAEIGALKKLKLLDLSHNSISELPDTMGELEDLQQLNLSHNQLTDLPNMETLTNLIELNTEGNQLESIPAYFCSSKTASDFVHLSTLSFKANKISEIPPGLINLQSLKIVDLSENEIKVVPGELADGVKLKEVSLGGNPLKDRRLTKLIGDTHTKPQKVLEYIRSHCPKTQTSEKQTKEKGKKKGGKGKGGGGEGAAAGGEAGGGAKSSILIKSPSEEVSIIFASKVATVRPYLVCCVVRGLSFEDNRLKNFLVLQNKFHDDDKLCGKRNAATIATHDLSKVSFPLTFTSFPPNELKLTPLKGLKEQSGKELVAKLTEEAEALRKKEKRNTYSGIHKIRTLLRYLYLLKNLEEYPCLVDSTGTVLSFPPITNSDDTKMDVGTKDLLIEISSSQDLATCKRIMSLLLVEMLKIFGTPSETDPSTRLTIQQVKIVNESSLVHVTFPDKNDLNSYPEIFVEREWE